MENLTGHTPTELLKMINDSKLIHETLIQEIIDDTFIIDNLEKKINEKLENLMKVEASYVNLIEELNSRK
jgi:hypothetical protein